MSCSKKQQNSSAVNTSDFLSSPLLSDNKNNKLLKSNLSVSLWNTCGLKSTPSNPNKLDNICSNVEIYNPHIVMFTETHLDPNPNAKKHNLKNHPLPRLKSYYEHYCNVSPSSASGGVSVISKIPIKIHYMHDSGNLIHFSVSDGDDNSIPFILCYANPKEPYYYYNLILERAEIIPDSIICGDMNTDLIKDHYFNQLLLKPLLLTPDTDPDTAKPTYFPRGNGSPKHLDWFLLPPSLSLNFKFKTTLVPQISLVPISDHLFKIVEISPNEPDPKGNKNMVKWISNNLFKDELVKKYLSRASKRLAKDCSNPFDVVYKYLHESFKLLTHLSKEQAIQNKRTILEAKKINKNEVLPEELSLRMNEILQERTQSTRDRFKVFVARSRNSPSIAMTLMQKQKSLSKTIAAEDANNHVEYWKNLYQNKDTDEKEQFDAANQFFNRFEVHRKGILSPEASKSIEKEFTADEISSIIESCPNRSSPGKDGVPYEVFKLAHPSFIQPLTFVLNKYYSNPDSLPDWIGTSCISLLFKKGDIHEPSNYRPISLLPTLWKVLSNALTQRLNIYMKELIRPEQVGFIKSRNIEVALHTIDSVIKEVPGAYVIAVDFEKAFDSISHIFFFF